MNCTHRIHFVVALSYFNFHKTKLKAIKCDYRADMFWLIILKVTIIIKMKLLEFTELCFRLKHYL